MGEKAVELEKVFNYFYQNIYYIDLMLRNNLERDPSRLLISDLEELLICSVPLLENHAYIKIESIISELNLMRDHEQFNSRMNQLDRYQVGHKLIHQVAYYLMEHNTEQNKTKCEKLRLYLKLFKVDSLKSDYRERNRKKR